MTSGREFAFILVVCMVLVAIMVSFIDNLFESKRCDRLEKQVNMILDYDYSKGCRLPGTY